MKTPVLCWLLAAALVGLTGLLRNAALPVAGLCALLTLAAFGVLAVMPGMRRKAMAVSIEHLVALSLMRFWGLYVIWLGRRGLIAADMATIAGWGPLIVAFGVLAVLFVLKRDHSAGRTAVLVWNIVGVLDITMVYAAVVLMAAPDPLVQGGFASLPLSLLPTFAIPLLGVTHILIFIWWAASRSR